MKNECCIVKDLLPLYVESMVSECTKEWVEQHLQTCESCRLEVEMTNQTLGVHETLQEDVNASQVMKRIKSEINKNRMVTGVFAALIAAFIMLLVVGYVTAPAYVPYSTIEDTLRVQDEAGRLTLIFEGNYELNKRDNGVYEVSVYHTYWEELFDMTPKQSIVINPDQEMIQTLYYVSNGEEADVIIYGENPLGDGGVITLPRLFLNYYFTLVGVATVSLLILLCFVRKQHTLKHIIIKCLVVFGAYLTSHLLVTGIDATSYAATRDFYLILLVMSCLVGISSMSYRRWTHNTNLMIEDKGI